MAQNNKCNRCKSSAAAEGFLRVPELDIRMQLGFMGQGRVDPREQDPEDGMGGGEGAQDYMLNRDPDRSPEEP